MEQTKSRNFDEFLKDKKVVTQKEEVLIKEKQVASKSTSVKTSSFRERAVVRMRSFYVQMKKAFIKGGKFGLFLFSMMLFFAGPAYVHYLNSQLYNYIKLNGGFRREAAGHMGHSHGMRHY